MLKAVRFGLLVPSSNTTMEHEFFAMIQMAEGEITLHTARMPLQQTTIDELLKMESEAGAAADRLAHADVDIICYGCTSGSLIHGLEFARGISEKIQEKTGIPTVTTSEAVLAAIHQLRLNALDVITPYTEDINQKEVAFLESAGIKVRSITGLGLVDNLEIGRQDPASLIPIVRENYMPNAEGGVFISCTNLRTIEIIQPLEDELRVPVFSSNTTSLFGVLKTLNISYTAESYGRLLKST